MSDAEREANADIDGRVEKDIVNESIEDCVIKEVAVFLLDENGDCEVEIEKIGVSVKILLDVGFFGVSEFKRDGSDETLDNSENIAEFEFKALWVVVTEDIGEKVPIAVTRLDCDGVEVKENPVEEVREIKADDEYDADAEFDFVFNGVIDARGDLEADADQVNLLEFEGLCDLSGETVGTEDCVDVED